MCSLLSMQRTNPVPIQHQKQDLYSVHSSPRDDPTATWKAVGSPFARSRRASLVMDSGGRMINPNGNVVSPAFTGYSQTPPGLEIVGMPRKNSWSPTAARNAAWTSPPQKWSPGPLIPTLIAEDDVSQFSMSLNAMHSAVPATPAETIVSEEDQLMPLSPHSIRRKSYSSETNRSPRIFFI